MAAGPGSELPIQAGAGEPVPESGTQIPAPEMKPPTEPVVPTPGAPPVQAMEPDPFVLLSKAGSTATTKRTLRALDVPGGVILKSSWAFGAQIGESMCFIPETTVKKLQAAIK